MLNNQYIGPVNIQPYRDMLHTSFDDSMTMLEKVNKIIYTLNSIGELTEQMLGKWNEVYHWVQNEGLDDAIVSRLNEWLEDGTLENIINDRLFNHLNDKIDQLDKDMSEFKDHINQMINNLHDFVSTVNIENYGASETADDNTAAINKAIEDVKNSDSLAGIRIPKGVYKTQEIRLPSNITVEGSGWDSVLQLSHNAPASDNVLTTKNDGHAKRENITIKNLMVDANKQRLNTKYPRAGANTSGTGVGIVYAEYVIVDNVKSINPVKHNFSVDSYGYSHQEGPNWGDHKTTPSLNVWITNCYARGAGDDNYTTHYSGYIHINNCVGEYPDATLFDGNGNSNNFEADDGSYHVNFTNCYARGGVRGFTSEAHDEGPAPYNITFTGCIGSENIRAFDARHIGFHGNDSRQSPTAQGVSFNDCTAYNPKNTGLYSTLDPRALQVGAYRGVQINNFKAFGGDDDINNGYVVNVHFNARDVDMSGVFIQGFENAEYDIMISGSGGNAADYITMSGVHLFNSAPTGVRITRSKDHVSINGLIARNNKQIGHIALHATQTSVETHGVTSSGYNYTARIGGFYQNGRSLNTNKPVNIASSSGETGARRSVIMASSVDPKANGDKTIVGASTDSGTDAKRSMILSSYQAQNPDNNSVAGGHSTVGGTDAKVSSNRTWQLRSSTGNIYGAGSVSGGHGFSDYGEYFESKTGEKIPTGTIVALDGDKIIPATSQHTPIGVISETAGVKLGGAPFTWQGRYKRNEFGGYIYEWTTYQTYEERTGETITETELLPVENEEHDPQIPYTPREQRDEWHVVGLLGQVHVRTDGSVNAGDFISPDNGIATKGDRWQVMRITKPYDADKGYGVAIVLVK